MPSTRPPLRHIRCRQGQDLLQCPLPPMAFALGVLPLARSDALAEALDLAMKPSLRPSIILAHQALCHNRRFVSCDLSSPPMNGPYAEPKIKTASLLFQSQPIGSGTHGKRCGCLIAC